MTRDAAERLLEKVRAFASELDEEERIVFAALIAPAVAEAYEEAEVHGFGFAGGLTRVLPEALSSAIRRSGIRIADFEE